MELDAHNLNFLTCKYCCGTGFVPGWPRLSMDSAFTAKFYLKELFQKFHFIAIIFHHSDRIFHICVFHNV